MSCWLCNICFFATSALVAADFLTVVHHDDLASAQRLLQAGADVNAPNRYGVTPLSAACTNGNGAMVRLLLQSGAKHDQTLAGGETPLMTCARAGSLDGVKALLAAGAPADAKEPTRGQTALLWAAAEGHTAIVEALLAAGADPRQRLESGFTPALFAAREGHIETLKALLKAGVDPNETIPPQTPGKRSSQGRGAPPPGTSLLHMAVANAHFDLAAVLLDAGANPNADGNGRTALHVIAGVRKPGGGDNDPPPYGSGRMTSLEFVRLLKAKGADLNARITKRWNVGLTSLNTTGATPFLLAARSADAPFMRLLAELGADPKIPNADGATPLIVAAGLGTRSPGEDAGTEDEVLEAVKIALELGNDIDAVDQNGETAMHGAAYKNLPRVVEYLASRGANAAVWNRKNKQGWTPLTIAEGYRFGNFKPSPPTIAAFKKALPR